MITKLLLVLKKWALPLVLLYAFILTYLSLVAISDVPSLGFDFDDKIYHSFAYFVFTLVLFNYFNALQKRNALIISAMSAIVYGIIIELLQYVLTTWRTFDVYDAIANTLGAIIASILIRVLLRGKVKID